MIETLQALNGYVAIGSIVLFVGALVLVYDAKTSRSLEPLVRGWGLFVAFLTALVGVVTALLYSEYFGIIPCGLCWLSRIALFPQALILGIALFYKDTSIARYGLGLSLFGIVIGLYHHYLQMGGSEFVKCPAAGAGADCAKRVIFEFGFVTFPLVAVFVFTFLAALYYYILALQHDGNSIR